MRTLKIILFILFAVFYSIFPGIRSVLDSIKIIKINSLKQKIINKNYVIFEGDVEILLDHKIQIMADRVEFDKANKIIIARAEIDCFVKLENPDFVMLAEYIELNLEERTGSAKNLKIHVKDGFISADSARKIDDKTWEMDHIRYTSCDHSCPHWVFVANRAALYKNSVLKASGLFFKIKEVPVFFFPGLVFPLQNRAGSGFLMPKLSYDPELGFGFKQEYYWLMGEKLDTTIGFKLIEEKGFIISDEFRWARGPENFFIVNSYYAEEWNALLERRGRIVLDESQHYWIKGNYFSPFRIGSYDFRNLIRFDFGTDKRVGYHFLNNPELVEDSFENTAICRYRDEKNIVEGLIHSEKSLRNQFSDCSCEKVTINYLPRCEWGSAYKKLISKLFYRHDILVDHAYLKSHKRDLTFEQIDIDTARFIYKGRVRATARLFDNSVSGFFEPHLHLRSNVKNKKSNYKGFASFGVEWAFPEKTFFKPIVRWNYRKKFSQNHWYHIDKYDRIYPENRLELVLRSNWESGLWDVDLCMSQGYDFYDSTEIFPLRRGCYKKHLLPFHISAAFSSLSDNAMSLDLQISQDYSWKDFSLIESEILATLHYRNISFFLAFLYQKELLQRKRELFSDIPVFASVGCTIPFGKSLKIHYDGDFYMKNDSIKPLAHNFCLNYTGHCWGLSLGFEEKRYRQYGKWKRERAITLALRLESVGSFSQKFRRPTGVLKGK